MNRLTETAVTRQIAAALRHRGWDVLHYHPPSGQPSWCLIVGGQPVYPDIVAYRVPVILTMENKGIFSTGDVAKLKTLLRSEEVAMQLIHFVESRAEIYGLEMPRSSFELRWAHGFSGPIPETPRRHVSLIRVAGRDEHRVLTAMPPNDSPLDL